MSKWATNADIRAILREQAENYGQPTVARLCNVSQPYINQVLNGVRGDGLMNPKILEALGYEATPYYKRKH